MLGVAWQLLPIFFVLLVLRWVLSVSSVRCNGRSVDFVLQLHVLLSYLGNNVMQDMYDKQRGKKRGGGSDADSDDGQIGFGSSRPKKKDIMSDEQVACRTCSPSVSMQPVCKCVLRFWRENTCWTCGLRPGMVQQEQSSDTMV